MKNIKVLFCVLTFFIITPFANHKALGSDYKSPVSISTKPTDFKMCYQACTVADIEIKEVAVGALEKGKEVRISIIHPDLETANDFLFAYFDFEVTTGNLVIENVHVEKRNTPHSYLVFTIKSPSTDEPAVIKLKDLGLKADRTIPAYKDYYYAVAWGTAIKEDATPHEIFNQTPLEYKQPYTRIITSVVENEIGTFDKVIKFSQDKSEYYIDDNSYQLNGSVYFSQESQEMMIPLRVTANALGVTDDKIIWDSENSICTILIPPDKVVQFKVGSDEFFINGASMKTPNLGGYLLKPEMKGGKTYVPFTMIASIFSINSKYIDSSRTVILNDPPKNPKAENKRSD